MSIGTAFGEEEYEFTAIADALFWHDHVVVADAGTQNVRIFDRQGRHVRTLGREGRGPGEFILPLRLRVDSTIRVFDPPQGRVVVFDASGRELETLRVPDMAGHAVTDIVMLPDGRRLVSTSPPFQSGAIALPLAYLLLERQGGQPDTLARYSPGATVWYTPGRAAPWGLADSRFGAGGGWAVRGDTLAVADGYRGYVHFLRAMPGGRWDTLSTVPLPGRSHAVSASDLRAVEDSLRGLHQRINQPLGNLAFEPPERWSVARKAVFSQDGQLWIHQWVTAGGGEVWTPVSRSGAGQPMVLPPGFHVLDVQQNEFLGYMADQDGVQTVHLIRVE